MVEIIIGVVALAIWVAIVVKSVYFYVLINRKKKSEQITPLLGVVPPKKEDK